jgi:hypothetical protein
MENSVFSKILGAGKQETKIDAVGEGTDHLIKMMQGLESKIDSLSAEMENMRLMMSRLQNHTQELYNLTIKTRAVQTTIDQSPDTPDSHGTKPKRIGHGRPPVDKH